MKVFLTVSAILLITAAAYLIYHEIDRFQPMGRVMKVPVYSKIPLQNLQGKKEVALMQPVEKAETTCSLEIVATSQLNVKGYKIVLERKPLGLYIDHDTAYIRGETDDELLNACHAFMCLREGLICDDNLMKAKNITLQSNELVIVLDNRSGVRGGQAFVELLGALGFIQAKKADKNQNGIIEQNEADKNKIHIYPYIKYGETCQLQQFKNALQVLNITNDTVNCDQFMHGIHIQPSSRNEVSIDGRRIRILCDEEHVLSAANIVRDILSPEFIRFYYRKY